MPIDAYAVGDKRALKAKKTPPAIYAPGPMRAPTQQKVQAAKPPLSLPSAAPANEIDLKKEKEIFATYSSGEETTRLINSFKSSSVSWNTIESQQIKEFIVIYFMDRYKESGVKIKKAPAYYVSLIDSMSEQDSELLKQPFDKILQVVSIIEYDFDNGKDKDALAKMVLGEEGYIRNKKRLGME